MHAYKNSLTAFWSRGGENNSISVNIVQVTVPDTQPGQQTKQWSLEQRKFVARATQRDWVSSAQNA